MPGLRRDEIVISPDRRCQIWPAPDLNTVIQDADWMPRGQTAVGQLLPLVDNAYRPFRLPVYTEKRQSTFEGSLAKAYYRRY